METFLFAAAMFVVTAGLDKICAPSTEGWRQARSGRQLARTRKGCKAG